ncbi:Conserved_hypothetical protein [Hexamita inflata]|uniref:C2H2-type domain-containing protein n=1 Tax=Hexamita inflata TaxID=28002 RepID=A0AA86UHS2_9EUKA|nr:Conserved hypothetical protein [Hexamita inflata]
MYICQFCNMEFENKTKYTIHMRSHTNERPFICDTCQKTFKSQGNLTRHKLFHTDTANFACEHCDKKFKFSTDLKRHQKMHDNELLCVLCDNKFKKFDLKNHQIKDHADFFADLELKNGTEIVGNKNEKVDIEQIKQLVKQHGYDVVCKRFYQYESLLRKHIETAHVEHFIWLFGIELNVNFDQLQEFVDEEEKQ